MLRKIALVGLLMVLIPFSFFYLANHFLYVRGTTIKSENEQIETLKQNNENLVCILKANKRIHQIGEQPDIRVEIMNKTDSTILMVRCLDGSPFGFRLPTSKFTISHQLLGNLENPFFGCANVNPLKESDFQEVKPGNSFDPYGGNAFCRITDFSNANFLIPGIYQLTYNYSTVGNDFLPQRNIVSPQIGLSTEPWYFFEGKEEEYSQEEQQLKKLESLWKHIPKVKLQSNTITIEYNLFTNL